MKKLIPIALLALGTVSLSGCVIKIDDNHDDGVRVSHMSDWQKAEKRNREYIQSLSLGTDVTAIKDKLGAADFNEMIKKDDKAVQVLYYRTMRLHDDGVTTKDECTALVFVDNELVGWGDTAVKQYL